MRKALTIALVILTAFLGMSSCEGPYTDPNTWEMGGGGGGGGGRMSFNKGTPSSAVLSKVGLTTAQFDAIIAAAGGGYKGYYVASSSSGRAVYDGYQESAERSSSSAARASASATYKGAFLYACWENRQGTDFKSLVQTVVSQTGIQPFFYIDWNQPNWETQLLQHAESEYGSMMGDFRPSNWYMAVGANATYFKVWSLMWARNNSTTSGTTFRKGDMLFCFVDLSGYTDW